MELTAAGSADARAQPRRLTARIDPPAITAWTLAFSVVFYLALSNGGYDTIVRSQVGIAVWWIVLLGALTGVLPMRFGRAGWVAIGLLAAFAVWTGLAATWSESAERSVIELGRVVTYLGVLVLAIALQGRAAARHTINGLACAIGFVTLLAVLSRLHPQWFPVNDQARFLGASTARKLSYPLNYWNGLAAFAAIGVPLLLGVALGARTLAGQAVASATLPVSALCIYLTISRGGVLALVVGVGVFLAFVPRRLDVLCTLAVSGIGSAILVSAASQRDAVQDATAALAALDQGTSLLWLALIACAGVALLQVAVGLLLRHTCRPALLAPTRRATLRLALVAVAMVCATGVAADAPGWANDRWHEFKSAGLTARVESPEDVFGRLASVNGNGRYQYWQAALDASRAETLQGIGPGAFELWWARHATTPGYVRDGHSLYFETLSESGIVGFALIIGMMLLVLCVAFVRSLCDDREARVWTAAAVGGIGTFLASAGFEWVWELGAIGCTVMILSAVIVGGKVPDDRGQHPRLLPRIAVIGLAAVSIGAVSLPMAAALATRESRVAASAGDLRKALERNRGAQRLQPYAATPHVQRALLLERSGALSSAIVAARSATDVEPTNWRTWFILARLQARIGNTKTALAAIENAKALNPRSAIVGGG